MDVVSVHLSARRRSSSLRIDERIQLELRKINAETATIFDLFYALNANDYASINTVLAHGVVDVNETDNQLWTPLMVAACNGQENSTRRLLSAGADTGMADLHGCTALMIAACNGHEDCLLRLIGAGAELEQKDDFGNTALSLASIRGRVACVKALVRAKASVENVDERGLTPVAIAALHGQVDVLEVLLQASDLELESTTRGHNLAMASRASEQVKAQGGNPMGYRLAAVEEMMAPFLLGTSEGTSSPEGGEVEEAIADQDDAVAELHSPEAEEASAEPGYTQSRESADRIEGGEQQEESTIERVRRIREEATTMCEELVAEMGQCP